MKQRKQREKDMGQFTKESLEKLFENSTDVMIETYTFTNHDVTMLICEGMIDQIILNDAIYERFVHFFKEHEQNILTKDLIKKDLYVPDLQELKSEDDITKEVFAGKVILLFHDLKLVFSMDIAHRPQRQPEETSTEISIKGPRDDFIEDIFVNIALVRKRLRTNSLVIDRYELGTRTQTQVALLYIKDVIDPEIIKNIDERLRKVDVDGIFSGTRSEERRVGKECRVKGSA